MEEMAIKYATTEHKCTYVVSFSLGNLRELVLVNRQKRREITHSLTFNYQHLGVFQIMSLKI